MQRIIFHIDVNSAYLSWTATEMLENGSELDIRTIPAIIGGDKESRHGIVLAKSVPAKKYGITTGEPVVNALRKCPNLHMEPPDHRMYREKSRKLMEFLRSYTPDIEQVSVDECYMDFTGIAHNFQSPVDAAMEIKDRVCKKFGFTVNVGISSNKLLAKMASDFEKPNKVHTLFPEEIQAKMWTLPVRELFMAGKSSVETLKKLEIITIGDLAQADPKLIEIHLKKHGRMLWEFANGLDDSEVQTEEQAAKGIGNSTTLAKDVLTEAEARKVLLRLAESVGRRLRKAGQKAGMVSVEIKYSDFKTASHQKQLEKSSNADTVIYETACDLFEELWDHAPVRLLGIRTSKLEDEGEPEQLSLFDLDFSLCENKNHAAENENTEQKNIHLDNQRKEKLQKLGYAMDAIRQRYGKDAVVRGSVLEKSAEQDAEEEK